jgi:hypothetical protein
MAELTPAARRAASPNGRPPRRRAADRLAALADHLPGARQALQICQQRGARPLTHRVPAKPTRMQTPGGHSATNER